MSWRLKNTNTFLYFECEQELVVYNRLARTTSYLDSSLTIILNIFKGMPQGTLEIDYLIEILKAKLDLSIQPKVITELLTSLENLELIETVE